MSASSAKQVYSREEARRMLRLTERQLRSWEKQGLVPAREEYALRDLLALNTLVKLRQNHVHPAKVRRAVMALREKIQHVGDPLTQLRIYSDGGRIRVDLEGGTMEPVSGQLLLDFGPAELKKLLAFPTSARQETESSRRLKQRVEAEMLFEKGLLMEQAGAPIGDIVAVYERAAELDAGCTGALVNLGTIYFNTKEFEKAEQHYLRAIEVDPQYALAHFNLGNLYDEQSQPSKARDHYMAALELNAQYADAHYNIALLYQSMGDTMNAVRHWKAYLKVDPNSSWSAIARRELEKLKDATIVRGRA